MFTYARRVLATASACLNGVNYARVMDSWTLILLDLCLIKLRAIAFSFFERENTVGTESSP